jgi:hypothetical protein
VPYALFSNNDMINKSFSTKAEVWDFALKRGLVTVFPSNDEDRPRQILDLKYSIRLLADNDSITGHPTAAGRQDVTS